MNTFNNTNFQRKPKSISELEALIKWCEWTIEIQSRGGTIAKMANLRLGKPKIFAQDLLAMKLGITGELFTQIVREIMESAKRDICEEVLKSYGTSKESDHEKQA